MESGQKSFTIRIYLTNGEKLCFKSTVSSDKVFNMGSGIENSLKGSYLGLDLNNKLTIIPFQHILKIEIDPVPDVLITHVLRNIEPVEE